MTHAAYGARRTFETGAGTAALYRLDALAAAGVAPRLDRMPFSIKVLLEAVLRNVDGELVREDDVRNLAAWSAASPKDVELPYMPARVILQDFTGVPAVVDLASMRGAVKRLGGDPRRINPLVPVDLVVDHSVQVDVFASAEAVMLGQPLYMVTPQVVGFRLTGGLRDGVTATDLVLTVTQMLRKKGVVEKFVEFYGPGLAQMTLADRATIANMAPEYGATCGFFPVDDETLGYLRRTGRTEAEVTLVERYCKEQGLFRTEATPDPVFTDSLELDLGTVEPSLAGPKRPQDRVALAQMKEGFRKALVAPVKDRGFG